jgi:hypothetical protein
MGLGIVATDVHSVQHQKKTPKMTSVMAALFWFALGRSGVCLGLEGCKVNSLFHVVGDVVGKQYEPSTLSKCDSVVTYSGAA